MSHVIYQTIRENLADYEETLGEGNSSRTTLKQWLIERRLRQRSDDPEIAHHERVRNHFHLQGVIGFAGLAVALAWLLWTAISIRYG
jgi:hypothetical protein